MSQLRRRHPRRSWGEVSLVLTDDAGMARINRLYLDREGATDVISFAWPAGPETRLRSGGELFINVQRAVEASRKPWDANRELALYMAHAWDHLSGASDRTRQGRRRMRERELRWLRKAAKQHRLNGLLNIP